MKGINKAIVDEYELYLSGLSIPDVTEKTGIPVSTLRHRFNKAGILRSRADGVRLAAKDGKLSHMKGKTREFTAEWKDNISKAKQELGRLQSVGVSVKPSGYSEITRGIHKGKSVHVVVAEIWLGRPLNSAECVHHIDGDKRNNQINNLAILTKSGHARLHRFEDKLAGIERERCENGTWC